MEGKISLPNACTIRFDPLKSLDINCFNNSVGNCSRLLLMWHKDFNGKFKCLFFAPRSYLKKVIFPLPKMRFRG